MALIAPFATLQSKGNTSLVLSTNLLLKGVRPSCITQHVYSRYSQQNTTRLHYRLLSFAMMALSKANTWSQRVRVALECMSSCEEAVIKHDTPVGSKASARNYFYNHGLELLLY